MTLEEIVNEMRTLDIDFALFVSHRAPGLSDELCCSLDYRGNPRHPAFDATFLLRGVQMALNLCDVDPGWAADVSGEVQRLSDRLSRWPESDLS
jgi:hypothetical protein